MAVLLLLLNFLEYGKGVRISISFLSESLRFTANEFRFYKNKQVEKNSTCCIQTVVKNFYNAGS